MPKQIEFGGGRIDNFRKGWAMEVGSATVHYWTRISILEVRSRCGLVAAAEWTDRDGKRHPRMHVGEGYRRCKRCEHYGEIL